MQVIRGIVIIVGTLVTLAGLYLLIVGLGATIELPSVELGSLKASAKGIGAGAVVSAFGLAMMWLPMAHMKRSETVEVPVVISPPTESAPAPKSRTLPHISAGVGPPDGFRIGGRTHHVLQDKPRDREV